MTDYELMGAALEEAARAAALGEVPVGAVVARNGEIIAAAHNTRETEKNALHHAELLAIDAACKKLGGWRLWQCELFVTLEPCPMCSGGIINSRIRRVVYGAADTKAGCCGSVTDLFALPYNHRPACEGGVLEEECAQLLRDFFRALRLAPGDADIRYNLDVANTFTKDKIAVVPEFFLKGWVRSVRMSLGCTAWSVVSLAALALLFALVLLYLLAGRLAWRKAGFYGTVVAALLFMLTTWFAVGERREMLDDTSAVVMTASTAVKSSPDKSSTDLFVLHEGTVVTITDRLDGWCEVVIADGKKGWVEGRKIQII